MMVGRILIGTIGFLATVTVVHLVTGFPQMDITISEIPAWIGSLTLKDIGVFLLLILVAPVVLLVGIVLIGLAIIRIAEWRANRRFTRKVNELVKDASGLTIEELRTEINWGWKIGKQ